MSCVYFNWPYLFDEKLVDVSDIAEKIAKRAAVGMNPVKEAVIVNANGRPFRSATLAS